MKCRRIGCNKRAKWLVGAVFGMRPKIEVIGLCNKHKDEPKTILSQEKIPYKGIKRLWKR